ncbi:protein of unknown function (plasmid) [Xenorhabdus nematophila AN6/1]|nr:protein of unknown function [Xenorhabdus nematophila AN6/1]
MLPPELLSVVSSCHSSSKIVDEPILKGGDGKLVSQTAQIGQIGVCAI